MTDDTGTDGPTYAARFRIPRVMWEAYGRVVSNRNADLVEHVRSVLQQHGNERDLADLAAAEDELTTRHARKGGRPRKAQQSEVLSNDQRE